jgi:hypothetical protein
LLDATEATVKRLIAHPQPVAPTGEIAGLVERLRDRASGYRSSRFLTIPAELLDEAAAALTASEAEAADLRRKLEEHQDAEDKAAREMATVIQGLRNRATAAERKMEEARKALEASEQKIIKLYRVATPHGNYDDELTINGHRSGNNFADGDETVIAIRRALSGASE